MPLSEMLVEPVHTAVGFPFSSSTMNLLCFWAPPDFRGAQTLDRPTWLIIFTLSVAEVGLVVEDLHVDPAAPGPP